MDFVVNNRFEVFTPNGWSDFSGIRRTTASSSLSVSTKTYKLRCTIDHPIKTKDGFLEAQRLSIGDLIDTALGFEPIIQIQKNVHEDEMFYDLIYVQKDEQYFTNDILSHNCSFIGSSGTLVSGACLKTLQAKTPLRTRGRQELNQYVLPEKGRQYVIVADVSRGKGLDYSAAQIIDVTSMPYNQVCTYRSNMVTPVEYAKELFILSKMYENASILVESNDIGGQVADILFFDYEHDGVICTENAGSRGKRITSGFGGSSERGIRTTKTVKAVGCSILKLLIEQYQLVINDHETIYELSRFSKKGTSYEAESGCHDDLVMGLVLFAWLSDQQFFKELTDINTLLKLRDRSDAEIEDQLTPFGFIMDGSDEDEMEAAVIDLTVGIQNIPDAYRELLSNF